MRRVGLLLLGLIAAVSTALAVMPSRAPRGDSELSAGRPTVTTTTLGTTASQAPAGSVPASPPTSIQGQPEAVATVSEPALLPPKESTPPPPPPPAPGPTVASTSTSTSEVRRPAGGAPSAPVTEPPPAKPEPPAPDPGPPAPDPAPPAVPFAATVSFVSQDDLGASWREGCPVGPRELRRVTASHWGFDGAVRTGQVVVHADQADAITRVLHRLYDIRFPIERMEPIDAFGGSDDASMEANNTSAFNCRAITGGSSWSEHSYGRAIDVNPVQNPYVKGSTVAPEAGREYLVRGSPRPGMIQAGDAVVSAFRGQGYVWGGSWQSSKDYQHFSTTGR